MLPLRQGNDQQFPVCWVPRMTSVRVALVDFRSCKCQRSKPVPEVIGTSLDFQISVELASILTQTRNEIGSQLLSGPITCSRDGKGSLRVV